MFLNPYKMKRTLSIVLSCSISSILTYAGLLYFGLIGGMGAMVLCIICMIPIGLRLSKSPYTPAVEGDGVMAIDLNSTGNLQPFILQVNNPRISGKLKDKEIKAYFDRNVVSQIADPIPCEKSKIYKIDNGDIIIYLNKEDYQKARFSSLGKPVFFFNSKTKTFYTKESIQEMENTTLSLHSMLLFMVEQGENILTSLKSFERYTISLLNQKGKGTNFGIIIIIAIIVVLAIIFMPNIMKSLQGVMGR